MIGSVLHRRRKGGAGDERRPRGCEIGDEPADVLGPPEAAQGHLAFQHRFDGRAVLAELFFPDQTGKEDVAGRNAVDAYTHFP